MGQLFLILAVLGTVWGSPEELRCRYSRKVECSGDGEREATAINGAYVLMPHSDSL